MKKQTLTISLLILTTLSYGQLVKEREEGKGTLIVTPSLTHNLSEIRISSEAGLTVGIEAINNQSSFAVGYNYRRYWDGDIKAPSYHAISLNSVVYPFYNFGLGFIAQSDFRRGDYLDKKVTVGADVLDDCGTVIGKLDDTRGSKVRNKVFGSIGMLFKIDQNFKVETSVMLKDYAPNRWHDPVSRNPYGYYPIKVRMSYTIPVFNF